MAHRFERTLKEAEEQGSWAAYAVYTMGAADTGDEELDYLLADLYATNESVHRKANQLSLRYDLPLFNGE